VSKRERPRRSRKLTTRKALHVVAEEFRALEPHERPIGTSIDDPATLRVSIVRRWLHRRPGGDL